MNIKEAENSVTVLGAGLAKLDAMDPHVGELCLQINHLREEAVLQLNAWNTVYLVRHPKRPKAADYTRTLFPDFMEPHGDRCYGDDAACQGSITILHGGSVTVLAQSKRKMLEENAQRNFRVLYPEGYRKVVQLAKQAEKLHRPIITLVDTVGACLGKGAEKCGRVEAVTQCLVVFSETRTSVLAIALSEGGSGGTLVSSVTGHTMMLEYAIYSILPPEDFASILWEDKSRAAEAAGAMELTAADSERKGIIDMIIAEPKGGAHICFDYVVEHLREQLENVLDDLCKKKEKILLTERYEKYRVTGADYEEL